jgi:hypothetical protein
LKHYIYLHMISNCSFHLPEKKSPAA